MAEYILTRTLTLELPIEEVFEFFSNAANLERITPPELNFRITTPQPFTIEQDTLIDYKLKLRGLPITWQTIISEWNPPYAFTDMALKSPYKQWIHRHTFTENEKDGTDITDEVRYRLPLEPVGDLFHWYVRRELNYIFDFRQKSVTQILQPDK
jgi:ligand-binding SRPBCC domain-containing protein